MLALQSIFDLINIRYGQLDIKLQTLLSFPAPEDNGLLIMGQNDSGVNQAFFIDCRREQIKFSRFNLDVGPINHWQGSCSKFKNMTVFLTEDLELMRFSHQTCDWSKLTIPNFTWVAPPQEMFEQGIKFDRSCLQVQDDGSHLIGVDEQ